MRVWLNDNPPEGRDPARIDLVLERLKAVWEAHPDLRLGQLLSNAAMFSGSTVDLFSLEDDIMYRGLNVMRKTCK